MLIMLILFFQTVIDGLYKSTKWASKIYGYNYLIRHFMVLLLLPLWFQMYKCQLYILREAAKVFLLHVDIRSSIYNVIRRTAGHESTLFDWKQITTKFDLDNLKAAHWVLKVFAYTVISETRGFILQVRFSTVLWGIIQYPNFLRSQVAKCLISHFPLNTTNSLIFMVVLNSSICQEGE